MSRSNDAARPSTIEHLDCQDPSGTCPSTSRPTAVQEISDPSLASCMYSLPVSLVRSAVRGVAYSRSPPFCRYRLPGSGVHV